MKKPLALVPGGHSCGAAPTLSRRDALALLAALGATSALPACRRPEEEIVPFVQQPEQVVPGNPLHFATALPLMGTAFGVVVESHEGRPTKIEGNALHPESLGATSKYIQASILDLYDPDRSRAPRERAVARSWPEAESMLTEVGASLVKSRGRGLAVITADHRSATFNGALRRLAAVCPEAVFVREEPFNRDACTEGLNALFGRPLEPIYDFSKADVILSLEADFLDAEGSSVRASLDWSARRDPERGPMNRLYAVESTMSLTGANADHRFTCESGSILAVARNLFIAIAAHMGTTSDDLIQTVKDIVTDRTCPMSAVQIEIIGQDLLANPGRCLILAGDRQAPAVHTLAHYLNHALGNVGNTVRFVLPFESQAPNCTALIDVLQGAARGSVTTALIFGANLAYTSPADIDTSAMLKNIPLSIHIGTHVDETAALATWHLNRAHPLETWDDAVSADGTAAIMQPLMMPLFGGRTDTEIVQLLLGRKASAYDFVQETWRKEWGTSDFDARWRRVLHDGVIVGSSSPSVPVEPQLESLLATLRSVVLSPDSPLELVFVPDSHTYDGRFANNPWLLELPDPITKLTWANAARVSRALAHSRGLTNGDIVTLRADGRSVQTPIVVVEGQAVNTVSVSLGLGRRVGISKGHKVGVDFNVLRNSKSPYFTAFAHIERTGKELPLARTQEHFSAEGRALACESAIDDKPNWTKNETLRGASQQQRAGHPAWGIAIDLGKCTGCSTCVVACQAENNIAVVGFEGIRRHRFMHWLRVDRYFAGTEESPTTIAQPVLCQQCGNAPCESVCPVGATSHSPEGLNDMAYNRCVGSRYCANNCPFKVRRFNYFEYWNDVPITYRMQLNPDVTVRSRGVMEKCTFCVQRINRTKIEHKRLNKPHIDDGAITMACEQACPTRAITFGNLGDSRSRVASSTNSPRSYRLLDGLNLDPRVYYLKKIRNPNPALEA